MTAKPAVSETKPESLHKVFIGLGSNVGDRMALLQGAINKLPGVIKVSPLYETDPIGGPEDQPDFLNCVVELKTSLTPHELLALGQQLEIEANRVRTVINGPRTLDVDILLYDDISMNDEHLTIPHPRMWERRFVVQPLLDIAPDIVTADALASAVGEVRRFEAQLND